MKAVGVKADLTDIAQFAPTISEVTERLGPPDIAIFNPMPPRAGGFFDLAEEDYAESFNKLVLGFIRMSKLVLPHMRANGFGRIITIGSGTAKQPARGAQGYAYALPNTIRLAAVSVSKSMAAEVAPFGVTVALSEEMHRLVTWGRAGSSDAPPSQTS